MTKTKLFNYDSPLGTITIACKNEHITGLYFNEQKYYPPDLKASPDPVSGKYSGVASECIAWLDTYFSGDDPGPVPALALEGSDFRKAVWSILLEIPYGEISTYGEIAKRIAKERGIKRMSAQAVGGAVGHNPVGILVPCHRVLGSDGSLTGYAGGLDKKEYLLKLEGIL